MKQPVPAASTPAEPSPQKKPRRWRRALLIIAASFLIAGFAFGTVEVIRASINNTTLDAQISKDMRQVFGDERVEAFQGFVYGLKIKIVAFFTGEELETAPVGDQTFLSEAAADSLAELEELDESVVDVENLAVETAQPAQHVDVVAPRFTWPPAPIEPIVTSRFRGRDGISQEGVWVDKSERKAADGGALIYHTIVRPNKRWRRASVDLVAIRPDVLDIHWMPGSGFRNPETGERSPGIIPEEHKPYLVADFNGGFQLNHDNGGMIYEGVAYRELRRNKGTFIAEANGRMWVGRFDDDIMADILARGSTIDSARQNLSWLIADGEMNSEERFWGYLLQPKPPEEEEPAPTPSEPQSLPPPVIPYVSTNEPLPPPPPPPPVSADIDVTPFDALRQIQGGSAGDSAPARDSRVSQDPPVSTIPEPTPLRNAAPPPPPVPPVTPPPPVASPPAAPTPPPVSLPEPPVAAPPPQAIQPIEPVPDVAPAPPPPPPPVQAPLPPPAPEPAAEPVKQHVKWLAQSGGGHRQPGVRSGIGMTAEGVILYAVGRDLTPATLAMALRMAGAVGAMHLDMNPAHVAFNTYSIDENQRLDPDRISRWLPTHLQGRYARGYDRDFFYVTLRSETMWAKPTIPVPPQLAMLNSEGNPE